MLPVAAHLPQPVVRVGPVALQPVHQLALHLPRGFRERQPRVTGQVQAGQHLSPHVELPLLRRAVAGAHRLRPGEPGQPVEGLLGDPAPPVDPIHDPQLVGPSRGRADQPLPPGLGLLEIPAVQQRLQGEGRVAQPAVPVVPVALPADLLGQRRRRRGEDPAGRRIRQPLDQDQGTPHLLGVRPLDVALVDPVLPEADRGLQRLVGLHLPGRPEVAGLVGEHERHPLPLRHRERRRQRPVLVGQLGIGVQPHRVRPGDRVVPITVLQDPRAHAAVVEPQTQLHRDRHRPPHALHDPHDVGDLVARRHEVQHPHGTRVRLPRRLQHQRLSHIPTRALPVPRRRRYPPPAVRLITQQRRETRGRVEVRQAQPVHRPVPVHQGPGVQVTDERVVLDPMVVSAAHGPRLQLCRHHDHRRQ